MITCPNCGHKWDQDAPVESGVFKHTITFERTSDQGNGAAAILFRTLREGDILAVSVNGEDARKGKPYRGAPVFLLTKSGDQYSRPLKFIIKMSDGKTYTAVSGSTSESEDTSSSNPSGYKHKATYSSYGTRNGRKAWRIPKKGPEFGSSILFVFSSGKSFLVKNTSKNCRDRSDTCNRDSKSPMYGFVFKPGIGPNGEGDSDTGTSHGGIYLHAPYGDSSQKVTVYYNK